MTTYRFAFIAGDRLKVALLIAAILLVVAIKPRAIQAQEEDEESSAKITITSVDSSSLPYIELRAVAQDAAGRPMNLATTSLMVTHGDQLANSVEVIGSQPAGSFTVFLIDVSPGVTDQIVGLQDAILQYASEPTMNEQVDMVAVYRVGESRADPLLEPTGFHNSIRNFFASELQAHVGLTALYDSLGSLMDSLAELKPRPDMVTNLVVVSDGTDAISTQFTAAEVAEKALAVDIPVHTIWLDNLDLSEGGKEAGRSYLTDLARQTNGATARMDAPEQLPIVWNRIVDSSDQTIIHYQVSALQSGDFPVELSLTDQPQIKDTAAVTILAGSPQIALQAPSSSLNMFWSDLSSPLTLGFRTDLSWLDGEKRDLERAQLIVNGLAQEVDPRRLNDFTAEVDNLGYGINTIRVAVLDNDGGRATSPVMLLVVDQGEDFIPEVLEPNQGAFSAVGSFLSGATARFPWQACLGSLLLLSALLILLGGLAWWFRIRIPGLNLPGRGPERSFEESAPIEYQEVHYQSPGTNWTGTLVSTKASPYLEIVSTDSRLPETITLDGVETRLGRSPTQADVSFERDVTVSRLHASIVQDGYEFRLYDEESTSGTLVNGIRVPKHGVALIDGDEIQLGAVQVIYHQS